MQMDASARYFEHCVRKSCRRDAIGLSYNAAACRLKRADLVGRLSSIGERAESLGLSRRVLRELLLAAGARGSDAEHVIDVSRLLAMDRFLALEPASMIAVSRALAGLAPSRFSVVALLELVSSGLLLRLGAELRHQILRYISGPIARSRSRKSALLAWHSRRAPELLNLARSSTLDPETRVCDFLDEVVRPLHIFRNARGLAIVVLGDPYDRRSLSYEKRGGFRIESPASLRGKGRLDRRSTLLSRREELELVTLLEEIHLAFSHNFVFDRRAEELAQIVASSRGLLAFERQT